MSKPIPIEEFQKAHELILQAQNITIICHKNPDADAIGANLALREALENIGKTVTSACVHPPPEDSRFLKGADKFVQEFDLTEQDLVISVDCGGYKLLGFHVEKPELLDRKKTTLINIDHHPSNDHFGTINIVMDETPATCFILYLMITSFGWSITQDMATALLHGLYFDTGCFMHSNVTPETLRIAGRLTALRADHKEIIRRQFHTSTIERLRLWGLALSRTEINNKNAIVSAITQEDYKETKSAYSDLSGLINYLNHVPTAKFCMLLTEDGEGQIKGSLRTQNDDIDLSEIAELFGGGGHKKAAGFTIKGTLRPKTIWEVQ